MNLLSKGLFSPPSTCDSTESRIAIKNEELGQEYLTVFEMKISVRWEFSKHMEILAFTDPPYSETQFRESSPSGRHR